MYHLDQFRHFVPSRFLRQEYYFHLLVISWVTIFYHLHKTNDEDLLTIAPFQFAKYLQQSGGTVTGCHYSILQIATWGRGRGTNSCPVDLLRVLFTTPSYI